MSINYPVLPVDYVSIKDGVLIRNGQVLARGSEDPADLYRALGSGYPKFFKMDALCKWAWLGAEALLRKPEGGWLYEGLDKRNIAVIIGTKEGSLDIDHRYRETMDSIPSPALFVYTLPNIMHGEICIRHGFMGEQLCQVQEEFDAASLLFWVRDTMERHNTSHCLFGWADVIGDYHHVNLFWADAHSLQGLSPAELQSVHNKPLLQQ